MTRTYLIKKPIYLILDILDPKIHWNNFCSVQYAGVWYQNQGLPAFFQPSGTRCIKANYGLKGKFKKLQKPNQLVFVWNLQ